LGEISHAGEVCLILAAGEDPADVTINKAEVARRMNVELRIGMEMVVAMVRRPPQHALLRRRLRNECENELKDPRGLIGAVGKVAMVASADGENSEPVKTNPDRHRLHGHAGPDRREASQMHDQEGYGRGIDDIRLAVRELFRAGTEIMRHGSKLSDDSANDDIQLYIEG
jgi:hypothetical protein